MTAPRIRAGVAALLAAGLLASLTACGGGGGGDAEASDAAASAPAAASMAATTIPGDGAVAAVAALGALPPVDPDSVAGELTSFESLGGPHDPFRQQHSAADAAAPAASALTPTPAEASAAASGAPEATPVPLGGAAVTAPVVPAPVTGTVTAPLTTTTPGAVTTPDAPVSTSATEEPVPAKRSETAGAPLVAELDVAGDAVSGAAGDRVPPGGNWLTLESVSAGGVVLRLEGALLPGGEDTVTLAVGEAVTLRTAAGTSRRVTLVRVRPA